MESTLGLPLSSNILDSSTHSSTLTSTRVHGKFCSTAARSLSSYRLVVGPDPPNWHLPAVM